MVASFQPLHAVPDAGGVGMWSEQLGPELAGSGWRLQSLLGSGVAVAIGNDWPESCRSTRSWRFTLP